MMKKIARDMNLNIAVALQIFLVDTYKEMMFRVLSNIFNIKRVTNSSSSYRILRGRALVKQVKRDNGPTNRWNKVFKNESSKSCAR